jgi:hypothetical protein
VSGEHDVDPLGARRVDRVEDDRGRVALLLRDHGHVVAPAPFGELLDGGRAEGVARGEQHRLALRLEELRELGDRRGLAGAVHAREQDHEGFRGEHGQRLLERGEERHERGLELALELRPVLEPLVALRAAQALDQRGGGGDAHVRLDQLRLELLVERLVDLRARTQHADGLGPPRARELEVLLEEVLEGLHRGARRETKYFTV